MTGVVGIDPGIEHTGIGIVTLDPVVEGTRVTYTVKHLDHLTVGTRPNQPLEKRCLALFVGVRGVLCGNHYLLVAMEEYMIGPNRRTAALVLQAEGAILAACAAARVPVRLYKPASIKLELTGKGNAKKHQVREGVVKLLHCGELKNEHEADALAAAVTAIRRLSAGDKARLFDLRKERAML